MEPINVSLNKNLVVNGLAQGWRALMSLAFIPLYINYLGTDAMGLVGLFALLQAWLVVVDLVIRSALWDNAVELTPSLCGGRRGWGQLEGSEATDFTRPHPNPPPLGEGTVALNSTALGLEIAQLSDGANVAQAIRTRLHKREQIGFAITAAVAFGIWAVSSGLASVWCATDGLMAGNIPVEVVAQAFAVMGAVFALQIIESIYAGGLAVLSGEKRPLRATTRISLMATVRGFGAVGVLIWFPPTLDAFFIWQGVVSLITVVLFAEAIYHTLPPVPKPARDRFVRNNVVANYFATWKPNLPRYRRLAKEGSWIVVGQIASVLGSLVLVRVLTEHLDPTQYGQLALALTLGTLVCQTAFTGSMPGIQRYYAIAAEKGDACEYYIAARRMMLYGTIVVLGLSVLLLLGLPLIGKADLQGLTVFTIFFTLLGNYNTTFNMIQNAARQRQVVALHGSLDAWLKVLFAVGLLTWMGNSTKAVIIGYMASLLLVLGSQSIFIRRLIPPQSTHAGKSNPWVGQIWRYSKPFVFFSLFTWIQASSDRWALDTLATKQDVGLYAVIKQLGYTPIMMVTGLLTALIAPILFQRAGDNTDHSRNAGVHRRAWQLTFIALFFTLLATLLAYLLHDWIFRLLVAAQYGSISYLLPWMILAGGIYSAGQGFGLKLMSDMNTQALVWPLIVTSILGALLSFAGAYYAGIRGVVYGAVIFSVLQLLWLGCISWYPSTAQK